MVKWVEKEEIKKNIPTKLKRKKLKPLTCLAISGLIIATTGSVFVSFKTLKDYKEVKENNENLSSSLDSLVSKNRKASDIYNLIKEKNLPLVLCVVEEHDGSVVSYIGQELENSQGRIIEFIFESGFNAEDLLALVKENEFNLDSVTSANGELILRIKCI